MQRIALLVLCLAAISCDKKVVKSVDVPVEDVAVEEALTEDVLAQAGLVCSGSLQLPTSAGLLAEDLQVYSLYDEATPNTAGAFSISMTESTNPQFVVAIDPATDNSLLLGYVDPLQSDQVHLSCASTAVGLAFLSPLMLGTTAEQRSEFIHGIKTHPNFSLLVAAVEATLQADPQHMLDGETHPALYEQAAAIAVEVWQDMAAAGKLLAPEEAQADNICAGRGQRIQLLAGGRAGGWQPRLLQPADALLRRAYRAGQRRFFRPCAASTPTQTLHAAYMAAALFYAGGTHVLRAARRRPISVRREQGI